ncbi:hypothetical protein HMPREF9004_1518 [Schaalia cardiffensis F0333]|uniref:Uncharacterized protein n=1 Tax=Schaalia cardiffensis F0333 TaxID=888050 RepID=N6X8Y6_9ACTO|nr:hypothetical protein HMPREF9004_1518 [Schaalia cardiffensis F0333]
MVGDSRLPKVYSFDSPFSESTQPCAPTRVDSKACGRAQRGCSARQEPTVDPKTCGRALRVCPLPLPE